MSHAELENREKGFALLELVVYLGLLSFVLSAIVLFSVEFVGVRAKSTAFAEATRNAKFAVSRIAYEVRSAESINYDDSVFDSSPGVLSLETGDSSTNPTVISVSDGKLMMSRGADSEIALTPDSAEVRNFTVSNAGNSAHSRTVQVQLTMGTENVGGLEEFSGETSYQTTVRVWRNDGFGIVY